MDSDFEKSTEFEIKLAFSNIAQKHMKTFTKKENNAHLAMMDQVIYSPKAAKLWDDPDGEKEGSDKMDITPQALYVRFLEIEEACDHVQKNEQVYTIENINKYLKGRFHEVLSSGDIKLLCTLGPWLYKLTADKMKDGSYEPVLLPIDPTCEVTGEWKLNDRRMIMFASIVAYYDRKCAVYGKFV